MTRGAERIPNPLGEGFAFEVVQAVGEAGGHQPEGAGEVVHRAGAVDSEIVHPVGGEVEAGREGVEGDEQGAHVGRRKRDEQAARMDDVHEGFKNLADREVFAAADLVGLVEGGGVLQRPDQAGDEVLDPQRLDEGAPVAEDGQESGREPDEPRQIGGEVVFGSENDGGADDGVGDAAFANVFLGNALGFVDGKGRGAVGAEVADEDEPFDLGARGDLGEGARAFDIGGEEVAAASLRGGAGEVVDLVHAAQGGTQSALVAEGHDRHFHGDAFGQARRFGRGAQEYAHLLSAFGELAHEGAPDKAGGAGDENHGRDYSI